MGQGIPSVIQSSRLCSRSRCTILLPSSTTTSRYQVTTRTYATGGGGSTSASASKTKKQAMKKQSKHQNQQQQDEQVGGKPDSDPTAGAPIRRPSRVIIDPTTSMTPISKFDSTTTTPSIPTRLDLNWSSASSSPSFSEWQSSYQNNIHQRPATTLQSGNSTSTKLDIQSSSSPTPEGIMSDDVTSSLVDLKDMYDPKIHLPYAPQDWIGYEPATPLSDELMAQIGVIGKPITTAEYMRQALTHPLYGYYTSPPKDALSKSLQLDDDDDIWDDDNNDPKDKSGEQSTLIGPKGDFVTAPEISHVFGHCICLWFVTQWQALNMPQAIQLVEFGPGRGTLMSDILQLAFTENLRPTFGKAIHTVHLIEASYDLRREQQSKLQETLGKVIHFEFDSSSLSPMSSSSSSSDSSSHKDADNSNSDADNKPTIRLKWHYDFGSFRHELKKGGKDKDIPVFMVLQEFLDALPVHAFERTEEGWRERLVDVVSAEDNPPNLNHTPLVPRLRQVLAPDVTPAVNLFFRTEVGNTVDAAPVGAVVEICPEAIFLVQDMAKLIEECGGAALMVDYGQEGTADTLRAFSNHKQVPLTSYPGQVDVTADVDFYALKNCLAKKQQTRNSFETRNKEGGDDVSAFGPVTQGEFLMRMGASEMVIALIEKDSTTEEQANAFFKALKFLVSPEHMGDRFKVMAIGRKRDGIFAPPGMEK